MLLVVNNCHSSYHINGYHCCGIKYIFEGSKVIDEHARGLNRVVDNDGKATPECNCHILFKGSILREVKGQM